MMPTETAAKLDRAVILLLFGLLAGNAHSSDGTLEFPTETNGPDEIRQLVTKYGAKERTEYQTIVVDKGAYLFLVSHDRGKYLPSIYTYVYGCDGFYCQLLAMRHSGEQQVTGTLNKNGAELVLRSKRESTVFLRMPLLLNEN